ncbi:MAG: proline--tRNA ligase [Bacteriovoracaceae bacterium]|jgi:prolyl-tRNA synthetase|nr:proline--tRNA ligase [Bacteriovoracaceae bacterium]
MRLSKGFWQTYKEIPNDAEIPSHQLMMRAGLIHKSGAGLYNYLPMGLRAIKKFEQIIRDEHDKIGCHEISMSVVTPGELWKETGRWDKMGDLMAKFKDKKDQDLCLSPTNEEAVTDIFRKTIKSYKQLPVTLYQINTKFRDEIRPRFGLMRGREFTMKDAYSFHMDKDCLDRVYQDIYDCYCRIFDRVGLEYIPVEADGGAMASSDSKTHEFQVVANAGEDAIIYSPESRYAANIEKAQTIRGKLNFKQSSEAMKNVSTPKMATIEDVCSFLKTEKHHSLKSLVYKAVVANKDVFVLALLLGDDELNEIKLQAFLKAEHLIQATEEEMKKLGLVKGFIGPVGVATNLVIVFDKQIDLNAAYVVGANEVDMHTENFIPSRDLKSTQTHDLRLAKEGDYTLDGKHLVVVKRGIEVGHVFQLGDKYTKGMSVQVLDKNGKLATPLMGCYGIGVTRVVAAAIEQSHDENGIIWPKAIAPYQIYFATIVKKEETKKLADEIYSDLLKAGFEVLYDDRDQGPGFKFKDADLIGLPIRLVLGERDYEASGELEIVTRKGAQSFKVKKENLVTELKRVWDSI